MRKQIYLAGLLAAGLTACHTPAEKLLIAGSAWNKIVQVDKKTKQIEWEYSLEEGWECNSVVVTPEKNILFSYGRGARMVTFQKETCWDFPVAADEDLQTAAVLSDGYYLLAWGGHPATLAEVSAKGEIRTRIGFETGVDDPHFQFRRITKNRKGNYLVPLFMKGQVWEIDPAGEIIRVFPVEGYPFCIRELPNGHYLVSCGDAHCFIEIDNLTGEVIRRTASENIPGVVLQFVAEVAPSAAGYYLCNWQGHEKNNPEIGRNPRLVEIDREGNPTWCLYGSDRIGFVSAVCSFYPE